MPVIQQGAAINSAVPDVYVQITPPQQTYINGIATNILGIVGVGSWGPVNSPVTLATYADAAQAFGAMGNRKYDLSTAVYYAALNGATNMRGVRVTDGTDAAAAATIGTNGLTLTGKYTGTLGNSITAAISAGTAANSWKLVLSLPGYAPETFDNLAAGLTGNAVWVAIAAAINNGASALRGPSKLVVASAGVSTTAPVATTVTLSGGLDGSSGVTATQMVGTDGTSRTGMYALRATGCLNAFLADCDASTSWTAQVAFGLSEGIYMIGTGPAGDTIANAVTTKATAGIDSYSFKLLFGDWCYVADPVNGVTRLISPQSFLAGRLSALNPQESALNKQLSGIVATQKTNASAVYSAADLQSLSNAGIDVVTNPCPGGAYFGSRIGKNTSSNPVINGDNYPRLTYYIAYTLNTAMGIQVGRLQTPTQRQTALGAITTFLSNMQTSGMIGDVNNPTGQAFSAILDASNNPSDQVALGKEQVNVRVTYLSVITLFLVNLEGGQSVSIASTTAA
ncbi:MAG: hypothetical protein OC190_00170 [Novosphingobium aromaticivorans]|nr:hypothetical protein [Novosphingobium aromaticivorans]